MNPEIKAKWVAALRSGEYKQGTGYLERNGCHCCLGVLCEISKLETGFGINENRMENIYNLNGCGNERIFNTIREWSGLEYMSGGSVFIDSGIKSLANHNDDGRTFLEIADAIEAQL